MIISGSLIYIGFRHEILFFEYLPSSIIIDLKEFVNNLTSEPGYFSVYCLPDCLWYGALLLYQRAFYENSTNSRCIIWLSIILPFILEFLQIHDRVPGTFDPLDILGYFVILSILIFVESISYVKK